MKERRTDNPTQPRVLLVTYLPFWRGGRGAHARIDALFRFLASRYETHLLHLNAPTAEDRRAIDGFLRRERLHLVPGWLRFVRKARRRIRKTFAGKRYCVLNDGFREDRRVLRNLTERIQPDAVVVEYLDLADVIKDLTKSDGRPFTLIDTHDAQSLRIRQRGPHGSRAGIGGMHESIEADLLRRFDGIIAIQTEEAAYFRGLVPDRPTVAAGHPHPVAPFAFSTASAENVLFVAADGLHNRFAAEALLETIWPAVFKATDGKPRLHIVGSICGVIDDEDVPDGVELHGVVDDLNVHYRDADVVVNPVFAGSGLKIKNVEALCHGKPLVTTPCGADGLDPASFCVAETPEAMAGAIVMLLDDASRRHALAKAAHAYALDHLSEEAVFADLAVWLDGLFGEPWRLRWKHGAPVSPSGGTAAIPPGNIPDIAAAHQLLDDWTRPTGEPPGVWWFARFLLVHDLLFRLLPELRRMLHCREEDGAPGHIRLTETPPDPWWEPLIRAVFPEAVVTRRGTRRRGVNPRRVCARLCRALLTAYRLRRLGKPKGKRVLVVQQARYWNGDRDTFWHETIAELEAAGCEVIPWVASHEDHADDLRPIRQRSSRTLFDDWALCRSLFSPDAVESPRTRDVPDARLIVEGVDLTPLVWEAIGRGLTEGRWQYKSHVKALARVVRRLRVDAVLMLDENGGEFGVKCGCLEAGVPVIAVQHGAIYPDHMHYIFPEGTRPDWVPLATLTAVRGPYYRRLLTEPSIYPPERVRVAHTGGPARVLRPWGARADAGDALRQRVLPEGRTRLLLFTSQDLLAGRLAEPLVRALAGSSEENYLVIRPHPREFDDGLWRETIASLGPEERVSIRRDGALEAWLDACDVHLSGSSTVLEEAVFAGRPNLVVDARQVGDWLGVLEGGVGLALDSFPSLDAAVDAWEARPIDEIEAARNAYAAARTPGNAPSVAELVREVLD